MKCARREAGAQPPAASAPSRPPSSRQSPPRDRSRPDPRGGCARLSRLLPVLALLLGALGLFAVAPAVAQTTVWSATLTVDFRTGSDEQGCSGAPGHTVCSTALTEDSFTYKGTNYEVSRLYLTSTNNNLHFLAGTSGAAIKSALARLTLNVGGRKFAIDDGHSGTTLRWSFSPGPGWTDGQTVLVSLTAPDLPAKPTGFTAEQTGNAEVTLNWDNPNDSNIVKYRVYVEKVGGRGGWHEIYGSNADTTSHILTGLDRAIRAPAPPVLEHGATNVFRVKAVYERQARTS